MNKGEQPANPAARTLLQGCVPLCRRPEPGLVVNTDKANCGTYIGCTLCMKCNIIFIYSSE